jgi:hypothetical protein
VAYRLNRHLRRSLEVDENRAMDATFVLHLAQATSDTAQAASDAKNDVPWEITALLAVATLLAGIGGTWATMRVGRKQAEASLEAAKTAAKANIEAAHAAARAAAETTDKAAFRSFQDAKRTAYTAFVDAARDLVESYFSSQTSDSSRSSSSGSSKSERRAIRVTYSQSLSLVNNGLAYPETRDYLDQFEVPPGAESQAWKDVAEAIRADWDALTKRLEHDIGMTGPWR